MKTSIVAAYVNEIPCYILFCMPNERSHSFNINHWRNLEHLHVTYHIWMTLSRNTFSFYLSCVCKSVSLRPHTSIQDIIITLLLSTLLFNNFRLYLYLKDSFNMLFLTSKELTFCTLICKIVNCYYPPPLFLLKSLF